MSGVSASQSGVRNVPLVIASGLVTIATGVVISMTGEYQAFMVVGPMVICIGSGLIYTLDIGSGSGKWIGYQVLAGIGMGMSMQIAVIVCQGVSAPKDLSEASAIALFFQLLGGAVSISVAQAAFSNKLIQSLTTKLGVQVAGEVLAAGATGLRDLLTGSELQAALESYMLGLKDSYVVSIALAGVCVLVAVLSVVFDRRKLGKGTGTAAMA